MNIHILSNLLCHLGCDEVPYHSATQYFCNLGCPGDDYISDYSMYTEVTWI